MKFEGEWLYQRTMMVTVVDNDAAVDAVVDAVADAVAVAVAVKCCPV